MAIFFLIYCFGLLPVLDGLVLHKSGNRRDAKFAALLSGLFFTVSLNGGIAKVVAAGSVS